LVIEGVKPFTELCAQILECCNVKTVTQEGRLKERGMEVAIEDWIMKKKNRANERGGQTTSAES